MAVGQEAVPSLDELSFPDHLGKRDYTDYDQTSGYFYDAGRDDDDAADLRKPGRKKDPNEPETKRRAQNRAAQRAFRERKERHLKDLETRVHELEQSARSWQNSNLMLRTKLSALEDELEHYRSGRVPPLNTAAPVIPGQQPPASLGAAPVAAPVTAPGTTWPAMPFDPLDDLQGPASVLPGRSGSITGLHGPATVLPYTRRQGSVIDEQLFGILPPPTGSAATRPLSLSTSSSPHSVPSEFSVTGPQHAATSDHHFSGAPPLVDVTTSSASSASSEASPWEGRKFCEQLQQAACPLPKLPLADQTPQIAPLTDGWEQSTPFEFSFGYREPTPHVENQPSFADLLNTDYGFFDPLEDPLRPVDGLTSVLGESSASRAADLSLAVPSGQSPSLYQDSGLYSLDLPSTISGPPSDFVKEENLSPKLNNFVKPGAPSADEVPAKSKKYMSCQAVWDRICSHPNFEGINLDELCSEFQDKARCSDSGVVLTEEDVESVLKRAPRRAVN